MNTTYQIQQRVKRPPRGKPFTTYSLLEFGTRAAIDQALSRLATAGEIVRLTHGVYVRPEQNRFVGQVLPEPYQIAQVIKEKAFSPRVHKICFLNKIYACVDEQSCFTLSKNTRN